MAWLLVGLIAHVRFVRHLFGLLNSRNGTGACKTRTRNRNRERDKKRKRDEKFMP